MSHTDGEASGSGKSAAKGPKAAQRVRRGPRGPYRTKLTENQRAVYEMRTAEDPPLPWSEISRRLGKDRSNIQTAYRTALKKMPHLGEIEVSGRSLEKKDPDKYAELVTGIVQIDGSIRGTKSLAAKLGVPPTTANAISQKLKSTYRPSMDEIREVKRDYLKRRWGVVAKDALDAITPEKLEKAGVRDLGILGGIATDKLLLLHGLPTQIVKTEADRSKISELATAFLEEVKRRGYEANRSPEADVVDVTFTRSGSQEALE